MKKFEDWLFKPETGFLGELVRFPFSLVSAIYYLVVKLRFLAYRGKFLKTHQALIPVISAGNLTLGGTGKTSFAIWLAKALLSSGIKPAISIRGYKSQSEKGLLCLDSSGRERISFELVGDEAHLLAKKLKGIPILVGKDRLRASLKAKDLGAEVLILDDGFQYLRLKRDLEIVLIDGGRSIFKERIFPRGRLREPVSGLKRANLVIITKSQEQNQELIFKLGKINPGLKIFKMRYRAVNAEQFLGKKVFTFAGIGDPEYFFQTIKRAKMELVGERAFSDHHYYKEGELKEMEKTAQALGAELLLTTEKDLVRIKNFKSALPILALEIEPDFLGQEPSLLELIIKRVKEQRKC